MCVEVMKNGVVQANNRAILCEGEERLCGVITKRILRGSPRRCSAICPEGNLKPARNSSPVGSPYPPESHHFWLQMLHDVASHI